VFFFLDLRLDFDQVRVPCSGPGCNYLAISPAEAAVLEAWGLSTPTYALILLIGTGLNILVYLSLAVLILWRLGTTRFGWTVSLALAVIPVAIIADSDNVAANFPQLTIPSISLSILGIGVLLAFVYMLPNGRFYPSWAAIPLAISFPVLALFFHVITGALELPVDITGLANYGFMALMGIPGVFQVLRYRSFSTPVERQQTKWIVFGLIGFLLTFIVWLALFGGGLDIAPGGPRLLASLGGWVLLQALISLLPITIALAILRYRLWDIDLLIRRTLIYGFLTALLLGLYFGSVVLLQDLFRGLFGETDSPLATVLSTLAIAALFNPLRTRVQAFIDRRFFRARYDAEQSLARFAAAARDEVDVSKLAGAMQGVVEETVKPERQSLWLK
jgi:hypothetical protein